MLPALLYYWSARAQARLRDAMKREIARGTEVTSVEYVRYRSFPVRNRAAETSPIHAYIARAECEPARKAGLFFGRGLIRTVVCIGFPGFHPYATGRPKSPHTAIWREIMPQAEG